MNDTNTNTNKDLNPANAAPREAGNRKRIPMSVPLRKLEVPELPGFHLYWFADRNVPRALQGGYEFVEVDELPVTQRNVANDSESSGSVDLGSRIRVTSGLGEDGKPEGLVLMKIREEWYREDQKVLEDRNAKVLSAIFRGETIYGSEKLNESDDDKVYVKKGDTSFAPSGRLKPLFQRPTRK